ncbi:DUF559 domain-containing protein [Snuella sedimenti]|uniref:DUF559 domain-containing protein n=1 Tax=Snuella sedimenti TaxID=2798802 RepID=UPI0021D0A042|nr:DUF559 domain-containing protein [Snuella sedimenti]
MQETYQAYSTNKNNNPAAQEYDRKRTRFLESLSYEVIRFENKLVFKHLASVLHEIVSNFKSEPSD